MTNAGKSWMNNSTTRSRVYEKWAEVPKKYGSVKRWDAMTWGGLWDASNVSSNLALHHLLVVASVVFCPRSVRAVSSSSLVSGGIPSFPCRLTSQVQSRWPFTFSGKRPKMDVTEKESLRHNALFCLDMSPMKQAKWLRTGTSAYVWLS